MPKLIALKKLRYGKRDYAPGAGSEEFEASEKDAALLKAIGKAADAPEPKPARKRQEPAKVEVKSEQPGGGDMFRRDQKPTDGTEAPQPGTGTYGRRDMRAQD